VNNVSDKIKPIEDALIRRCITLLGPDFTDIYGILCGQFDDEDELDVALNEVWIAHQSQSTEEEIGPLLEEVRQRCLAVKHSQELRATHDTNPPATDKIQEIEALLG
jgi:hypothetical protein